MSYFLNLLTTLPGLFFVVTFFVVTASTIYNSKELDRIALTFVYFFAVLFLGLRDQMSGTDTLLYINAFEEINDFDYNRNWEPVYIGFMVLISKLGSQTFFILANVIVQLILINVISKIIGIKKTALTLLVYISFHPGFDMLTNGLRQGLSSALILLFFTLLYYKTRLPKVLIGLSLIMHKSVVPYLFFPGLKKLTQKNLILSIKIIALSMIVLIVLWHLINFSSMLSSIFDMISFTLLLDLPIGEKLNIYLLDRSKMLQGLYKYYYLMVVAFLLGHFFILLRSKNVNIVSHPIRLLWLLTFYLSFIYCLVWISPYSYRFMYIMYLPGLISTILSLELIRHKSKYLFLLIITFIAGILTYGSNTFMDFNFIF